MAEGEKQTAVSVAAGLQNFEPVLVISILNSVQKELKANYVKITDTFKK